jgi:hypothetical protein
MARGRKKNGQFKRGHRSGSRPRKRSKGRGRRSTAIVHYHRDKPAKRRHHSGGGSMIPGVSQAQLMDAGGAAAYGLLERWAKGDGSAYVAKVPMPVPQLGFSGHVTVYAWLLAKYGPAEIRKYARHLFNGTLDVFAYQLAAKGGLFSSGTEMFTISGLEANPIDITQDELDQMAGLHPEDVNTDNV